MDIYQILMLSFVVLGTAVIPFFVWVLNIQRRVQRLEDKTSRHSREIEEMKRYASSNLRYRHRNKSDDAGTRIIGSGGDKVSPPGSSFGLNQFIEVSEFPTAGIDFLFGKVFLLPFPRPILFVATFIFFPFAVFFPFVIVFFLIGRSTLVEGTLVPVERF